MEGKIVILLYQKNWQQIFELKLNAYSNAINMSTMMMWYQINPIIKFKWGTWYKKNCRRHFQHNNYADETQPTELTELLL